MKININMINGASSACTMANSGLQLTYSVNKKHVKLLENDKWRYNCTLVAFGCRRCTRTLACALHKIVNAIASVQVNIYGTVRGRTTCFIYEPKQEYLQRTKSLAIQWICKFVAMKNVWRHFSLIFSVFFFLIFGRLQASSVEICMECKCGRNVRTINKKNV